jgi:hypothetical protein
MLSELTPSTILVVSAHLIKQEPIIIIGSETVRDNPDLENISMSLPVKSASRLTKKDLKGSRLRCLMLANQLRNQVAHFLNSLANPHAFVHTSDFWMPMGFQKLDEAKLGETIGFLSSLQRKAGSASTLWSWSRETVCRTTQGLCVSSQSAGSSCSHTSSAA